MIDPTNEQTAAEVESYYRNVKEGDVAVIRETFGGLLEFQIDEITGTNPKLGRVYLKQGSPWTGRAFYARTGKGCRASRGKANLVVPTEAVLKWAAEVKSPVTIMDAKSKPLPPGQRGEGD